MSVAETVKVAYPWTVHLVAKDVLQRGDKIEFALPGEAGTVDHAEILKSFYDLGYRKDVCCEVSGQISHRPGYDPAAAARTCYQNMNRVFEQAHLPRRHRSKESAQQRRDVLRGGAERYSGIGCDEVAVSFGGHLETMSNDYVALDETENFVVGGRGGDRTPTGITPHRILRMLSPFGHKAWRETAMRFEDGLPPFEVGTKNQ